MHDAERERRAGSPPGSPAQRKASPTWTYTFCVLQTFHRLCKTSESVRPLEEGGREGRREGRVKLTGLLSRVTAVLPSVSTDT